MFELHFNPAEGGQDALAFSEELASAVAKYSQGKLEARGRGFVVSHHRL